MLNQICENICNYFIQKRYEGRFMIEDGMISLPLLDGQRFLIQGSALNDGMYTFHDTVIKDDDDSAAVGLHDETFAGTICALAVPPSVIALSAEIKTWVDNYGDVVSTPYSSESVLGVYSYTKASGGSGAGGCMTWKDAFHDQLKRWRRVGF